MKNTKSLLTLIACIILITTVRMNAQEAPAKKSKAKSSASKSKPDARPSDNGSGEAVLTPEQKFQVFCDRMQLSEEQRKRLKQVAKENQEQMERMKSERKNAPPEEKRNMISNQLRMLDNRIIEILEPHQKDMYRQFKDEKRNEFMRKQEEQNRAEQSKPRKKGEAPPVLPPPPPVNPDELLEAPF
ncbi:MAG: hypothetical protein ACHQK8_09675 [Bacteroidia bacterium]